MSDELLFISRKQRLAHGIGRARWRGVAFVAVAAIVGALAGVLWAKITPLPSYTLQKNDTAWMPERAQAEVVAADIYFTAIVGVLGVACGILGWIWFQRSSWMVIAVPLVAASLASLACWQVGLALGPSGLVERLASAQPDDMVPIDLELRAMSALLVAPFGAMTPVMMLAAFWPEPKESTDTNGASPT